MTPERSGRDGQDRRAGLDIEALLAEIGRRPDDEQAAASVAARSRRRWLRQQVAESATMAGLLLTLAERGDAVTVRIPGGPLIGSITTVTTRLCVIDLDQGPSASALVAMTAITAVEGAANDVHDDRLPTSHLDLAAVLSSLVADRPTVNLRLSDGSAVSGTLVNVGVDVVSVRSGEQSGAVIHLPVAAIAACVLA